MVTELVDPDGKPKGDNQAKLAWADRDRYGGRRLGEGTDQHRSVEVYHPTAAQRKEYGLSADTDVVYNVIVPKTETNAGSLDRLLGLKKNQPYKKVASGENPFNTPLGTWLKMRFELPH